MDADIVGDAKLLSFIPVTVQNLKISNFTMRVGADTQSDDDQVHYKLGLDSWF